MATLQEIADAAGVSVETVSRVINGKLKEARASSRQRAAKIREIARQLNYKPNSAARAMVHQRSHQIGLFIRNAPDMPTGHLAAYETILGADGRLSQAGYVSCLIRLSDLPSEGNRSRVFGERLLDGVIVLHHMPEAVLSTVKEVADHCVWADSNIFEPAMCIRRDEDGAARLVVNQLAAMGYRKFVWVMRYQAANYLHFSFAQRQEGVRLAAAQRQLPLEQIVYRPQDLQTLEQLLGGVVAPDVAVVTYDAITAQQVFQVMVSRGLVAGRDYALASCDSDVRTDSYWPDLSRATFDRYQMGWLAAEMMLAALKGSVEACPSTTLPSQWVAGTTAREIQG